MFMYVCMFMAMYLYKPYNSQGEAHGGGFVRYHVLGHTLLYSHIYGYNSLWCN